MKDFGLPLLIGLSRPQNSSSFAALEAEELEWQEIANCTFFEEGAWSLNRTSEEDGYWRLDGGWNQRGRDGLGIDLD